MGQKITALHIDVRKYVVRVRALSKSRRGSTFTLHENQVASEGPGTDLRKAAVEEAIGLVLEER